MPFEAGSQVRSIDNPGRRGVITNNPPRKKPSGFSYHVRWDDGNTRYVYEYDLEIIDDDAALSWVRLVSDGRYGRSEDLRRNLTFIHLSGRLANLVYAMGITNTDFYAHQYKPLLNLLNSPINGLLIADEVGLGKTIEAGLIWTELRARFDMRRLLIVCPAVLREKWKSELEERFGIEARVVKADELQEHLSKPYHQIKDGRAWIISYQTARPPKDWKEDGKGIASLEGKKPPKAWKLADFLYESQEEEPLLDMVIFDEAHMMRNEGTGNWKIGELLHSVSEFKLMLSATPINLKNKDLFNILRMLDPDHFREPMDLARILDANRYITAARDAALNLDKDAAEIIENLDVASGTALLQGSQQLKRLINDPPTSEKLSSKNYRADLAEQLGKVDLLSYIITRTRKKDVSESKVERHVEREEVEMTPDERDFYDAVTESVIDYASHSDVNEGFLLASPQRQVTSCPAAIAEAWMGGESEIDTIIEDLENAEDYDVDIDIEEERPLISHMRRSIRGRVNVPALRRNDSKFNRLLDRLKAQFKKKPDDKIIVFTMFRPTAKYLADRLADEGIVCQRLWGGESEPKQVTIDRFRENSEIRVLVTTEVASEGVDLQFCSILVNYDLPWNPTRIEQRIGRIDRLGQKEERINIWNLYFKESIDGRVVHRLLSRLRIFEEALGEAEEVVGDEIKALERDLFRQKLTPEEQEKRIDAAAQRLENEKLIKKNLEENAAHMMAHGQRILERIEASRELSRRVTEDDLLIYVRDYLTKHWPGHTLSLAGEDPYLFNIKLPSSLAAELDDFLRSEGLDRKTLLASGSEVKCRFLNKVSEKPKKGIENIHQFHPIIRFVSRDLRERGEQFFPVVAVSLESSEKVPRGRYAFHARSWSFNGVRDEEYLSALLVNLETREVIEADQAEEFLQAMRSSGRDWIAAKNVLDPEDVMAALDYADGILEERFRDSVAEKRVENEDRANFQVQSIESYLQRMVSKFEAVRDKHIAAAQKDPRRKALAAATQGKINKLEERMSVRIEKIRQKQEVTPDARDIVTGVVQVL